MITAVNTPGNYAYDVELRKQWAREKSKDFFDFVDHSASSQQQQRIYDLKDPIQALMKDVAKALYRLENRDTIIAARSANLHRQQEATAKENLTKTIALQSKLIKMLR